MNAGTPIVPAEPDADQPAFQQPDWPPEFRCPFVPWRREGVNLMFRERVPQPGRGPRRVYLSPYQLTHGRIEDLEIGPDYLAEHFPPVPIEIEAGAACVRTVNDYSWSIRLVADWLRHHIAEATAQRDQRFAARRPRPPALAAPQPADNFHFVRPTAASTTQCITTLTVQRSPDHRRRINVTYLSPDSRDERAFSCFVRPEDALAIAEVLIGRRITP